LGSPVSDRAGGYIKSKVGLFLLSWKWRVFRSKLSLAIKNEDSYFSAQPSVTINLKPSVKSVTKARNIHSQGKGRDAGIQQ
jgi:hypothetical protein